MNLNHVALGGFALAATLAVDGHVDPNDTLDPWALTVSDFAVSDRGGVVDAAMVVMAAASIALVLALRRSGVRVGRRVTALFAVWCGGLLAAAVVPTDEPGLPLTTAGYVHRYASVAAFAALPAAGWLLSRHVLRTRWVRSTALLSVFFALAMVWSAIPGDRVMIGLTERLLLAAETGLLVALAWPVKATGVIRRPAAMRTTRSSRARVPPLVAVRLTATHASNVVAVPASSRSRSARVERSAWPMICPLRGMATPWDPVVPVVRPAASAARRRTPPSAPRPGRRAGPGADRAGD
ncbi:DUF998 domain-containing protein [Dactylosporangium roseum]|uniref:DUF998 domain-containing protein n=2 Tax=Dactylosporangium roseum TaxID=47989 RepID=A0ABY5ZIQ8_9ACTN|nr:DUF998 domain-containing protein [Dactylosporangium roseum]